MTEPVLIGYIIVAAVVALVGLGMVVFMFMDEEPLDDPDDARITLIGLGLVVMSPLWPLLGLVLVRKLYQVAYGTAD